MSRAMNIALPEGEVTSRCQKAGVVISAIEPLPSGGTHLVCLTSEGAEQMRSEFKAKLLLGKVKRLPFYVPPSRW
ncbi:hypothetical protein H7F51_03310 [Novosphingobium flavum]|uniref:Uncharacterized protein n=1 Tax=Novosphingobium flavum TaxID=1778672 RepID=A0A7X1KKG8_9SPHN|nr:hypothetical protein [Novosphingobium flavum]MBC2664544.1 hypothetical protein [Novosphingobium flavum]